MRVYWNYVVPDLMSTLRVQSRISKRDRCVSGKRTRNTIAQMKELKDVRNKMFRRLVKRTFGEPEPVAKRTRSQSPKVRVKKTKAEIKKSIKKSKKNAKKKWKGSPSQKRR